jgi:alpha-acetolactate decarboxylase
MIRAMVWRVLALALVAASALPVHATDVYQVSTISTLLAGGYDGDTTVGELLRHGGFGLGTFNGVDGEMMVLDGEVYRGTVDGRAHVVGASELTPFAVVVAFASSRIHAGRARALARAAGGHARCAAL